jgi:hypothetical protein
MRQREGDTNMDPDVRAAVRARVIRSLGGLVVAIGGVVLALLQPDNVYLGMGCAMVGAGLIDGAQVVNLLTRK